MINVRYKLSFRRKRIFLKVKSGWFFLYESQHILSFTDAVFLSEVRNRSVIWPSSKSIYVYKLEIGIKKEYCRNQNKQTVVLLSIKKFNISLHDCMYISYILCFSDGTSSFRVYWVCWTSKMNQTNQMNFRNDECDSEWPFFSNHDQSYFLDFFPAYWLRIFNMVMYIQIYRCILIYSPVNKSVVDGDFIIYKKFLSIW